MNHDGIQQTLIPPCLLGEGQYDPTIELLYEEDEDATEKRAAVREEASA